ncbi:ion channel [Pseudomonas fragi]|uniref:ion channel n=1 Tax=Pseudomonas fragi TaxID=296 RepID=UPI00309E32A9
MLKNILHEASRFKTNAIRFWNWRKKPFPRPRLTLEEIITEKVKINELCSDIINLSFVNFPTTPIKPWERRIVGKTFFKCIFSQETIEDFTFNNCHFTECVFNGAKIIDVEFHDCTFNECFFYKTKFTSTYIDPRTLSFTDHWHWDKSNVNLGLYQSLYRNLKDIHQDEFAMYADKKFQFYRRYQDLRGEQPNRTKFIRSMFFDYVLGYGYGITNTLVITTISIFLFALLIDGHLKDGSNYLEAFYFTVVSFTTAGYGEITPLHTSLPLVLTILFLLGSVAWCAVVTAIIVKRIVK